jgi:hypothetical protein
MAIKKIFRFSGWILLVIIILCAVIYFISWKSPDYYILKGKPSTDSIFPFKDYSQIIEHQRPFIISSPGRYTIFGSSHTRDTKHPEMVMIDEEWKKLKPTIALIEGRLDFLIPGIMDPVKNLGEGGKIKALARKDNVPLYNWDLSKEVLARQLLQQFNAEQIALAQILNPYFGQLRFGKPASPEDFIKEYFKRAKYVGQENNIKTAADIDRLWKKYFPSGPDWRDVNDENGLPGYLEQMITFTNDLRNRQLVSAVRELTTKGEKVFLICGSSHAACVATAFKEAVIK